MGGGDWKSLYAAAQAGDVAAVRMWLSLGTDPNAQHLEFGTTPLIAAAEHGHLEAVQALIDGGADPGVRSDWEGVTAADAADEKGFAHIAAWLRQIQAS